MAEIKTKPTGASVEEYLVSRGSPQQIADCKAIMAMCKRVTKQAPRMWGPSIVGYGSYTYKYESGHSGEMCLVGLAIRGRELVVYLVAEDPAQVARLARLGKHKMGGPRCQGARGTHCRIGRGSEAPLSGHRPRLSTRSSTRFDTRHERDRRPSAR